MPLFDDKHVPTRWHWSVERVDDAKRRGFPFLSWFAFPDDADVSVIFNGDVPDTASRLVLRLTCKA